MGDAVKVDPHGLTNVGKKTQEIAALMPGELGRIQKPSDEAVAVLGGWSTGAALAACTQAWEDRLRALAAEVDTNGLNMVTAAKNYTDAEFSVYGGMGGGR
ncbi:hypothetical protein [Kitasatospora sp. NPDC056181]|uniref:hypothetical protein n=1 Tax=Kitasatospora sp. NPDC056181 TaxID=3345737 RepID=UPI0035D63A60